MLKEFRVIASNTVHIIKQHHGLCWKPLLKHLACPMSADYSGDVLKVAELSFKLCMLLPYAFSSLSFKRMYIEDHRPNLYLVGFMGTGKSTVGRHLAHRLGMAFIDSDHVIEAREGRPIRDVFASEGEDYFRRLEREFVENGHDSSGCIVACGGGLVTQEGMVDRLKARGLVACLFASPETILERTSTNKNRPLLDVEDPEEAIRKLLKEREPFYLQAGLCIVTDRRPLSEVTGQLERFYKREAAKFELSQS